MNQRGFGFIQRVLWFIQRVFGFIKRQLAQPYLSAYIRGTLLWEAPHGLSLKGWTGPWLGQHLTSSFAECLEFFLSEIISYDGTLLMGNVTGQTYILLFPSDLDEFF